MKIDISFTVKELKDRVLKDKVAVIIDTLRATSTIITALNEGAKSVKPKLNSKQVLKEKNNSVKKNIIFSGEKNGIKRKGLDLGNSPFDYIFGEIRGKDIVFATTNGTKGILEAQSAKEVLIASLLNRKRVAEELIKKSEDVILCCAGTKGRFSLEDFLTAGAIIDYLKMSKVKIIGDDRVVTSRLLYKNNKNNLLDVLKQSENGKRLIQNDKKRDLKFTTQLDKYSILGYLKNDLIKMK
ncbi:MAG: 2-phosphosulfolactate phosphatase [Bacillota bacterium]